MNRPGQAWLFHFGAYGYSMAVSNQVHRLARLFRNKLTSRGLSPLSRAVLNEGLTYLAPAKLKRIEEALCSVSDVKGDFAEFGVALGGSAILIASHAAGRRFHGFDVFGMIPEPASEKDDAKSRKRYEIIRSGESRGIDGQLYYGYRSDLLSEVKGNFARHGLNVGSEIHLYEGLFEETLPTAAIEALALVHLDCDWYDPVSYCLWSVAAKLSAGGVIIIDDFHDYGGCKRAVEEFLGQNPAYDFEDGPNPILRRIH